MGVGMVVWVEGWVYECRNGWVDVGKVAWLEGWLGGFLKNFMLLEQSRMLYNIPKCSRLF